MPTQDPYLTAECDWVTLDGELKLTWVKAIPEPTQIIEHWLGKNGQYGMQDLIDLGKSAMGLNDADCVLFGECAIYILRDPEWSWKNAYEAVEGQSCWGDFSLWSDMSDLQKEKLELLRPRLTEMRETNLRLRNKATEN